MNLGGGLHGKMQPLILKPKSKKVPVSPCVACPYEARTCKIAPVVPSAPTLIVVSDAPDESAEFEGRPLAGATERLTRDALTQAGYDLTQVGFANLTRCRAQGDDLDSSPHLTAEKHCKRFLGPDLARTDAPILLLGERVLHRFWKEEGRKPKIGAYRGLWIEAKQLAIGRKAFIVRHPREIMRDRDPSARRAEFMTDILRMRNSLGDTAPVKIKGQVFESPVAAKDFLAWLTAHPGPWAFDIETYDAVEFPSRQFVSTDPCHPDFRVRGIAFAWAADEGAYVDLKDWNEGDRAVIASELFTPVFASPAEKWAFAGHFDEEGVVYTKLAAQGVCNRGGDGMLAMIALGDGTHDSLRLEKAVVDILKKSPYWLGFDKSTMRDAFLEDAANGAIGDATNTFELCTVLHERIAREDYLLWGS